MSCTSPQLQPRLEKAFKLTKHPSKDLVGWGSMVLTRWRTWYCCIDVIEYINSCNYQYKKIIKICFVVIFHCRCHLWLRRSGGHSSRSRVGSGGLVIIRRYHSSLSSRRRGKQVTVCGDHSFIVRATGGSTSPTKLLWSLDCGPMSTLVDTLFGYVAVYSLALYRSRICGTKRPVTMATLPHLLLEVCSSTGHVNWPSTAPF